MLGFIIAGSGQLVKQTVKESGLNKTGAKILLWMLILGMLGYTATRTLHFLQATFPPGEQYVAFIALVAFDAGVLGWFYYATHAARGAKQRAVAYGMIFVCAAGVIITTVADMLTVSAQNGIVAQNPQVATVGLWGCIIVIVLNVVGGLLVHLVDPAHLQHMKEEELHDKIVEATHKHMEQETARIAPGIAARLAEHWSDNITAELIGKLPPRTGKVRVEEIAEPESMNGNSSKKK